MFQKTLVMLSGNMATVALQAVQFILLARTLGATEFGGLAAVNAVVTILVPLAGLGYGNVMLMQVSRDRTSAPLHLGNGLLATLTLGLLLVGVVVAAVRMLYGPNANLLLALLIATTELVLVRCCLVAGQYFQAVDQIRRLSLINTSVSVCRVAAIGIMLVAGRHDAITWALSCIALVAAVAIWHVPAAIRSAGGFLPRWQAMRQQLSEAAYFAMGTTAKAAYTDLDKVILGRNAPAAALGVYTTAYRLVVMAFMPVRSLLDVSASRFFKSGEDGVKHTYAFSMKLIRFAVPYGIAAGIGLYVCAPVVPLVLGPSYHETADVLRWLAPLPAIQATHYVLSDALTGAGYQRIRTIIQFVVLAIYFLAALIVIPHHGWQGAASVCLASEALLAVLISLTVRHLLKSPAKASSS